MAKITPRRITIGSQKGTVYEWRGKRITGETRDDYNSRIDSGFIKDFDVKEYPYELKAWVYGDRVSKFEFWDASRKIHSCLLPDGTRFYSGRIKFADSQEEYLFRESLPKETAKFQAWLGGGK